MGKLYLTLSALQFKRGVCYPPEDSQWSESEIRKILALSGLIGDIPKRMHHLELVNLLLTQITLQTPAVFALDDGTDLIVDAGGMRLVKGGTMDSSLFARRLRLKKKAAKDVWNQFISAHTKARVHQTVMQARAEHQVAEQKDKLLRMSDHITDLQSELAACRNRQDTRSYDELTKMVEIRRRAYNDEATKAFQGQQQNADLVRQVQALKAQMRKGEADLALARDTLGDDWIRQIGKVKAIKEELIQCRSNLFHLTGEE